MSQPLQTLQPVPVASDALPARPCRDLSSLPGPRGHWLLGNLRQLGTNPRPYLLACAKAYGSCFTMGFLRNSRAVVMVGAQANETVLLDRGQNFSNRLGWDVVRPFFGRNILVRDFEDHRLHRRLMTPLFKPDALRRYLQQMQPILAAAVEGYNGPVDVYARTKQMALDIAVAVFAGLGPGAGDAQGRDGGDNTAWNRDLNLVLSNVMALRIPLPGSRYRRACRARDRLRTRLQDLLNTRRGRRGEDLFTQLANQRDEQGAMLSDRDVIDHMFGLLFAAHDTTASSLAVIFWLLAEHPEWQTRARQECREVYAECGSLDLPYAQLPRLTVVEAVCKEALRMYAPIQFLPRRSLHAFEFQGHTIPANAWVLLAPQITHFDAELYPQPDRFDPQRFLGAAEAPAFAFVPFGKGSHMCLGMHFAYMEIKAMLYRLLLSRRLEPGRVDFELEYLPIVRPSRRMEVDFGPLPA